MSIFVPRPYQLKAVEATFEYFNSHKGNPLIGLPTGCHAADHPILMFDGTVKAVQNVMVGDRLMGPDSKPRTVLSLARGSQEMVKITPTKGKPFVVNKDHILHLYRTPQKRMELQSPSQANGFATITVSDFQKKTKWFKHIHKLYRKEVDFAERRHLVHPYDLGCLLGDGSLERTPSITTEDDELVAVAEALAAQFMHEVVIEQKPENKAATYKIVGTKGLKNQLTEALEDIGLRLGCEDKHIPLSYKTSSKEQRLCLIAGLIDTDGGKTCNGFDFISKSKTLAEDLVYVCRSVGLAAYVKPSKKKCQTGAEGIYWRVSISGDCDQVPCQLARKQCEPRKQIKRVDVTGFKTEDLPEDNFYGFELSGDHLYLDGEFVVHHNTGKSVIPPMFMAKAFGMYPNSRFLLCTHVKELISQNERAMRKIWPTAPIGVCSAGLKRWENWCPIIYAGVASVYKRAAELGHIDLMFIDEAHLLAPNDNTMYQKLILELKVRNPYMKVIGMTATPFRMGQGYLTDDGLFTDFSLDMTSMNDFVYFIDEGYLSNLVTPSVQNVIDVSDVRQEKYDFNQRDLQRVCDKESIIKNSLEEAYELGRDRKSWMVFGAGVENCYHISERLTAMGVSNVIVHGNKKEYPKTDEQNDNAIKGFKSGYYRAIVNCNMLTTGFDHPKADFLIGLRPSTSVNTHVQILGRMTRPYYHPDWSHEQLRLKEERFAAMEAGGKKDALIADFADNISRLGPINDPRVPGKRGEGTGEMPLKICDNCGAANHTVAKVCAVCAEPFIMYSKLKSQASSEIVVRREGDHITTYTDEHWTRKVHTSKAGNESLKVTYFVNDNKSFTAYLGFGGKGYSKKKAHDWWRQHFGDTIPEDAEEAAEWFSRCRQTVQIVVSEPADKYAEILEYLF